VLELLDPLSIAAASSHFDVNVDSDDDNDVYDPIGIKHYVKVNIVYYFISYCPVDVRLHHQFESGR
jgi:hypothetical protein